MKTTTVYKVVTVNRYKPTHKKELQERFLSYIAQVRDYWIQDNGRPHKFVREYKLNRWTRPMIGRLFAFDTIQRAESYHGKSYYSALLECQATGVEPAKDVIPYGGYNNGLPPQIQQLYTDFWIGEDLKALMARYHNIKLSYSSMFHPAPDGTVWCDAIRPVRILWYRGEKRYTEPFLPTQMGIGTQPA